MELRWLQSSWTYDASKIEWDSSEKFWTINHFQKALDTDNITSVVCLVDDKIVGFNIYKLKRDGYEILNLVVDSNHRFKGVGTLFMLNLVKKLRKNPDKHYIKIKVRDTNENAGKFLEKSGFIWSRTVDDYFPVYDKMGKTEERQNADEYIIDSGTKASSPKRTMA